MPELTKPPSPCPICKNAPEIDYGLAGAELDPPFVICPTIHVTDTGMTIRCPMRGEGIEAWNYLCDIAKKD